MDGLVGAEQPPAEVVITMLSNAAFTPDDPVVSLILTFPVGLLELRSTLKEDALQVLLEPEYILVADSTVVSSSGLPETIKIEIFGLPLFDAALLKLMDSMLENELSVVMVITPELLLVNEQNKKSPSNTGMLDVVVLTML